MSIKQIVAELQSPDSEARIRAIRRLRVEGSPKAVTAIMGALGDPDEEVRARAAIALGQIEAREVVPALIEQMKSSRSDEAREICVFALAEIGDPRAVPLLIDALQDPSEAVVGQVCHALARLSDRRAIEPLLQSLHHPYWSIRLAACRALLHFKTADERLAAALEKLALEPEVRENRALRWDVGQALARIRAGSRGQHATHRPGQQDRQRAFERTMAEIEDPDPKVRSGAVLRLGRLGVRQALPALTKHLLHDESGDVRAFCAWRLLELGGKGVADALLQALSDSDRRVLMAGSMAAAKMGDSRAILPLHRLLEHSERNVRYVAARALLKLKAADRRLVSTLERLAQDPEAEEHDLEVDEWICDRGAEEGFDEAGEGSEFWPHLKMHELVEQARRLVAPAET